MAITPEDLAKVHSFEDLADLFNRSDTLDWPISPWPIFEDVKDLYEIPSEDIPGITRLAAVQKLAETQLWGIFEVEFGDSPLKNQALRGILNKVAQKAKKTHENPVWPHDNILFICHSAGNMWTMAYYRGDTIANSKLRTFSWDNPLEARTALQNLNQLRWQDQLLWQEAWSVEKLTKAFFQKLSDLFFETLANVQKQAPDLQDPRLFVQLLFNRLLFVRFLEERRKLDFVGRKDYLRSLWSEASNSPNPFWPTRLNALFQALNHPMGHESHVRGQELVGEVPYLNGGLFDDDPRFVDPRIQFPESLWDGLLGPDGLLYAYHFTAEESTPEHIHVAIDPEMLGRIFEQLTIAKSRHDSGSYYTPRDIVQFMCREALVNYLVGKNLSEAKVRKLIYEQDKSDFADTSGDIVWAALLNIKIVDPACGSGAYLLGMLQELFALYNLFDRPITAEKRNDYLHERKLWIIENCIYGVDFQAFAVNTAMLRLWLTLMVQDESEVPKALPNLDYKIEEGDSLMGPNPQDDPDEERVKGRVTDAIQIAADFEGKWETISELRALREKYQGAHGPDKQPAKRAFEDKLRVLREKITGNAQKDRALFDWRVEFFDVFLDDPAKRPKGFDVVAANPPYINSGELARVQGATYKANLMKRYPETGSGTADLLVYFMDRGVELLSPGGELVYITSNMWLKSTYGQKLRSFLARYASLRHLIDFGDLPVFGGVIAYPLITVATKMGAGGDQGSNRPRLTRVTSLGPPYPDLQQIVTERGGNLQSDSLGKDGQWRLETGMRGNRLATMREKGAPLKSLIQGRILSGIKTGLNDVRADSQGRIYGKGETAPPRSKKEGVFVIDGLKRSQLISEDPRSEEIIKPLAVGRGIGRWIANNRDTWLILTKIGTDMSKYPAVMRHLERFREKLEPRSDQGNHWWELRACAYYDAFERQKILSTKLTMRPTFCLDESGGYALNTSYLFTVADPLYILALLNSEVSDEWCRANFQDKQGAFEVQPEPLGEFPVPEPPESERNRLRALVSQAIERRATDPEADVRDIESTINELVEFLYFGEGDSYESALAKDQNEVLSLLKRPAEDATLEFKESLWYDVRQDSFQGDHINDVSKAICAMLNRDGGTILIGVADNGQVVGIERDLSKLETPDRFQRKLQEHFGVRLRPDPTDLVRVRFIPIEGKLVARVDIKPDAASVYSLNDKVYVRRDGESREFAGTDLALWWARRQRQES